MAGGARSENVYTYKPGSTIEIKLSEYVHHPGYFRIAFDDDGDDDFVVPASITGEHGDCNGDPLCGPGMEDFCNNDTVLIDNLDPHPGDGLFAPPKVWTWKVKLPNVECDNCTLQILQIMTDLNIHTADYPADDIYYQCIDLVLSNEATDEGVDPGPIGGTGMDCKAGEPMGGAGGMGGSGGMMATGGMDGSGGMPASGGMGGSGGAVASGGAGGMPATTGGAGGAAGTVASGGASGAAGAAGAMASGGAGGAVGGTGAPSSSGDDGGGCSVSNASAASALWPLSLALLFLRRRRA